MDAPLRARISAKGTLPAMKTTHLSVGLILLLLSSAHARDEWYRGLDLEAAVAQANLLIVAEVAEVGLNTTVSGGKMETTTRQYKFKPVRVLKGVFARPELALTSADLGISEDEGAMLERGRLHLLFLGRSRSGYQSCFYGGSLDRSPPPLADRQDPLILTALTLLEVANHHDRAARVRLLVEALGKIRGPAAIPLLIAVQRRPLLAAQIPGAVAALTRHLEDPLPAVHTAAATALGSILRADYLAQPALRSAALAGLAGALEREGNDDAARVSLLWALGGVGPAALQNVTASAHLQRPTRTLAAESARVGAIGLLSSKTNRPALLARFEQLPLDAPDSLPPILGDTLIKLDAPAAAAPFLQRARAKLAAGLGIEPELHLLGAVPAAQSVPVLLELFPVATRASERHAYADACRRVCAKTPDARLIASLSRLLDPRHHSTRWAAAEALMLINLPESARALQPRLREEADLNRKLRISAFLGRHGLPDGAPYALEHLSEPPLLEDAVVALAAIADPKAVPELMAIWNTSNDREWKTAALRAMAALGRKEIAPRLLEIVQDLRHTLAAPALIGLGDLGEVKALPAIQQALGSRNAGLAMAGARAAAKLLKADQPAQTRDRLLALLSDPEAEEAARLAALDALVKLADARLDGAMGAIARDARQEGTGLLARVEDLLSKRKVNLQLP